MLFWRSLDFGKSKEKMTPTWYRNPQPSDHKARYVPLGSTVKHSGLPEQNT